MTANVSTVCEHFIYKTHTNEMMAHCELGANNAVVILIRLRRSKRFDPACTAECVAATYS